MFDLSTLPRFPCNSDKTPRARWGGIGGARTYWPYEQRWPLAGVPTGGHSGFDVLDIDPEGLPWLRENQHRLPETRAHVTRRGGLHLFFHSWPNLRNSAGKIAPGVDVRAEGGFIIWWPRQGGPVANPDLLSEWPDWLVDQALQPITSMATSPVELEVREWDEVVRAHKVTVLRLSKEETYGLWALAHTRRRIAAAPVGQREATLNREAFSIGRLCGAGWISPRRSAAMLVAGMHENGAIDPSTGKTFYQQHGRDYIQAKVRRAILAGMQKPVAMLAEAPPC
jgi:bifunctional DNA primase/polymerase-like protein